MKFMPSSLVWIIGCLGLLVFLFFTATRGLYAGLLSVELLTIVFVLITVLQTYETN